MSNVLNSITQLIYGGWATWLPTGSARAAVLSACVLHRRRHRRADSQGQDHS